MPYTVPTQAEREAALRAFRNGEVPIVMPDPRCADEQLERAIDAAQLADREADARWQAAHDRQFDLERARSAAYQGLDTLSSGSRSEAARQAASAEYQRLDRAVQAAERARGEAQVELTTARRHYNALLRQRAAVKLAVGQPTRAELEADIARRNARAAVFGGEQVELVFISNPQDVHRLASPPPPGTYAPPPPAPSLATHVRPRDPWALPPLQPKRK